MLLSSNGKLFDFLYILIERNTKIKRGIRITLPWTFLMDNYTLKIPPWPNNLIDISPPDYSPKTISLALSCWMPPTIKRVSEAIF